VDHADLVHGEEALREAVDAVRGALGCRTRSRWCGWSARRDPRAWCPRRRRGRTRRRSTGDPACRRRATRPVDPGVDEADDERRGRDALVEAAERDRLLLHDERGGLAGLAARTRGGGPSRRRHTRLRARSASRRRRPPSRPPPPATRCGTRTWQSSRTRARSRSRPRGPRHLRQARPTSRQDGSLLSPAEVTALLLVHASDIHLDSPLVGLEAYDGCPKVALRTATRAALARLFDVAISERASLVLISGDLYDGAWKDYSTGLYFVAQARRLREADIPIVIVRGNHDAESQIAKHLKLPDNVRELSTHAPRERALRGHRRGRARTRLRGAGRAGRPRAPLPARGERRVQRRDVAHRPGRPRGARALRADVSRGPLGQGLRLLGARPRPREGDRQPLTLRRVPGEPARPSCPRAGREGARR
jgi:hypothetical protein